MSGQFVPQGITTSARASALLTSCQHAATQDKFDGTLAYVATPNTNNVGQKLITEGDAAAWWPRSTTAKTTNSPTRMP